MYAQPTLVESYIHHGYGIEIHYDHDPSPPDEGDDDSVLFVTTRNRYFEKTPDVCGYSTLDANTLADPDVMREIKQDYHLRPLYMYAHSGVSLSLGNQGYPFNDPWDSGMVGFVLVKKRAGFRNIQKTAAGYVETWNQYLSGDVYGYVVKELCEDEDCGHEECEGECAYGQGSEFSCGTDIDSCWGFYGLEYVKREAESMAEAEEKRAREQSVLECWRY